MYSIVSLQIILYYGLLQDNNEFLCAVNISLNLIYLIHSSSCLLIPYPTLSLLLSLSPWVATSLFSRSVTLFLFSIYIHLYYF